MTEPTPPVADRRPVARTHHGDTIVDEYAWLSAKDDPATRAYLDAENAYTEARVAHLAGLRETLFAEIKARIQQTDLSLAARHHDWWYYTRTVEGQQYDIHCRVPAAPGDSTPPASGDGGPLSGEQVMLDGNAVAGGHDFFDLGPPFSPLLAALAGVARADEQQRTDAVGDL
jgi:oligopeptidase B